MNPKTICINPKVDGKQPSLEWRVYDWGGVSTAITTSFLPIIMMGDEAILRRFTPREVYRLMGVDDGDIDKLLATPLSRTSHYKLAGNSIVVDCLAAIFKNLFSPEEAIPNSLF